MKATLLNSSRAGWRKNYLLENGWRMRVKYCPKLGEYVESLKKDGKEWWAEFGVDAWMYNKIFQTQIYIDLPEFAQDWIEELRGTFLLVRFVK